MVIVLSNNVSGALLQKPIRRGVVGHTLMVEELGRRKVNSGVSFVLGSIPSCFCSCLLKMLFFLCVMFLYFKSKMFVAPLALLVPFHKFSFFTSCWVLFLPSVSKHISNS